MGKTATSSVPTVLMIEDHDDTACLVRFILERNGYAVRHAPDGKNAKRLTESSEPPDLVLLDISLPSLSGFEVLRAIRSTPTWEQIPVVMLTANGRPESMAEASTLGATEYLKKPFTPEHLLRTVASFMSKPSTQPGPEVAPSHCNAVRD
ncbi:MAG: response regulator transcription factor [Nitrospira sp.]|nr:response regulator transcription factor [Nitrospira sp.]MDR4465299.1 response regulator transcription factor [Nitrospira sp.]MDR4467317.1 response regulator transcription factor [Nitrospira sp.]